MTDPMEGASTALPLGLALLAQAAAAELLFRLMLRRTTAPD
jgi:hypothetical protein